jgi:hypothetical protein
MSKETLIKWSVGAAMVALAACIPIGIGMTLYTDNPNWLFLCAPILIFLS